MEIKVFACSTYLLSLHLYLFYANDSAGSDRVVTAKNYVGSHNSIEFTVNESHYILNTTQRVHTGKESNSCELFGRKTAGKTKLKIRKKRGHQI